jgi:antitoxin FitA
MANLLVRDLPDDVHAALSRRAKREGQSLQQYLTRQLTRLAEQPTLEDVLERIAQHEGGAVGFSQAVRDLEAERARS